MKEADQLPMQWLNCGTQTKDCQIRDTALWSTSDLKSKRDGSDDDKDWYTVWQQ